MVKHISPTSDLVLGREALTSGSDSSVASRRDHNDRVGATAGVEGVWETVLAQLWTANTVDELKNEY